MRLFRIVQLKFISVLALLTVAAYSLLHLSWDQSGGFEAARDGQTTGTKEDRETAPSAARPERCSAVQRQFPDSIPPVVHWTSRDGRVASKLQPLVRSWRQLLNSSASAAWRFMHWDDARIHELVSVRYPQLASSFAQLTNGLERGDIGRLVVLHHVGGVYVDMDVELVRDITPWLTPAALLWDNCTSRSIGCFNAVWSQEPPEHAVFFYKVPRLISNAVMLSRANHSFLSYVLREWPAWFRANWAGRTKRDSGVAMHSTGPGMLRSFHERYASLRPGDRPEDWSETLLAGPEAFQPLWDEIYVPNALKEHCHHRLEALPQPVRDLCRRAALNQFRNRPVPAEAFTVHRFMHLSYADHMDFTNSSNISDLLPMMDCAV